MPRLVSTLNMPAWVVSGMAYRRNSSSSQCMPPVAQKAVQERPRWSSLMEVAKPW